MRLNKQKIEIMKLSNQALGAMMMALQRAILNQEDVTECFRNFEFVTTEDGLWIKNPPTVKFDFADNYDDDEESVPTSTG